MVNDNDTLNFDKFATNISIMKDGNEIILIRGDVIGHINSKYVEHVTTIYDVEKKEKTIVVEV